MLTRRTLLGGTAALAAGTLSYVTGDRIASAAAGLPLTIVNETGRYANESIWIYIVGTDLASGSQAYVRADGTLVPVSAAPTGPGGYADLAIALDPAGTTTIPLPHMSGRIYVSINDRLRFPVVPGGTAGVALAYPAGWVASDPNYAVLHDWVEFTFNDTGMYCNTTMVDMFSVPLAISLQGTDTRSTGTLVAGGRDAIFSAVAALPDFAGLVLGSLRVIAPGHGIDARLFSPTYFDGYIAEVWSRYARETLTANVGGIGYTGQVLGDRLVFSRGIASIARPTTSDVFYCAGALAAPNDGRSGPVAALLGAAFNRSTLLDTGGQPITNPSLFYTGQVTNHYSRIVHENTVDGRAYGFPFDDVGNWASSLQDGTPSAMTVTLTPF